MGSHFSSLTCKCCLRPLLRATPGDPESDLRCPEEKGCQGLTRREADEAESRAEHEADRVITRMQEGMTVEEVEEALQRSTEGVPNEQKAQV